MQFFYLHSHYVQYLNQFEPKVQKNYDSGKQNQKPYIGVVLEINGFQYYAPLTSPKDKYRKIPDSNPAIFKINTNNGRLLGIVSLNNMLPVPETVLQPVVFNELDEKYKHLLQQQYRILSSPAAMARIYQKAADLYRLVTEKYHCHFSMLSCDFKLLETKLSDYKE